MMLRVVWLYFNYVEKIFLQVAVNQNKTQINLWTKDSQTLNKDHSNLPEDMNKSQLNYRMVSSVDIEQKLVKA